jgi:hypothetical protein
MHAGLEEVIIKYFEMELLLINLQIAPTNPEIRCSFFGCLTLHMPIVI